jgi:glycerol-3-phosphate dehydrogenase (NAD(P)+)
MIAGKIRRGEAMAEAPIAILGAGSWGTALAVLLGRQQRPVKLWPRRPEQARAIAQARENSLYLPGIALPEKVQICPSPAEAIELSKFIILALPAKGMRRIAELSAPFLQPDQAVLSAAKGLEPETAKRMSEVLAETLPQQPCGVLSGPNLASEVVAGQPTTSVVASLEREVATFLQASLICPTFRVYTNLDVIGVELGGALKNVIAIAAGIVDGLGFGDNTRAALITRGLAEITRLGVAMGADSRTFQGLSGIGDLIATCVSPRSRNHWVGERLAKGENLSQILAGMEQIAEGVPTTRAAVALAERYQVEMPIAAHLQAVLFEGVAPAEAVVRLMNRPGKEETESWGSP